VELPKLKINDEIEELEDVPVLLVTTFDIRSSQLQDLQLREIINNIEKSTQTPKELKKNYCLIKEILHVWSHKHQKQVLMIPEEMIPEILEECHDGPLSGHLGFTKTKHRIESRYYWKSMDRDIKSYVKSCDKCQRRKVPKRKPYGLMQKMKFPRGVFQKIQIDVMGPLGRSARSKKYVITAIDYLSKWMESRAVAEATAETLASFFIEQIICRHGVPKEVNTDRGSIFTCEMTDQITKKLGVNHLHSTAFHPESQGLVEKRHSTLNSCITMYVETNQKNWDLFLPHITFALNTSIQKTTQFTPFFLVYGREAMMPLEAGLVPDSEFPSVEEMIDHIQQARLLAGLRIEEAQDKYAEYHNKKRMEISFEIGDKVLVRKIKRRKGCSPKLMHYYYGPYTVVQKVSEVNYIVEAQKKNSARRETVHVEKMKLYFERIPKVWIDPDKPEHKKFGNKKKGRKDMKTSADESDQNKSSKKSTESKPRKESNMKRATTSAAASAETANKSYNLRPRKVIKYKF